MPAWGFAHPANIASEPAGSSDQICPDLAHMNQQQAQHEFQAQNPYNVYNQAEPLWGGWEVTAVLIS